MPLDTSHDVVRWTLLAWLTVLGGCIGSFLNVVVYRVPRGKSLSHPGSRCPKCGHAIRWYHNLPVLGWLILRGRCHDCRAPISIRYPIVEAIVAALFCVLAATGPLSTDAIASTDSGEAAPLSPMWLAFAWESVLLCVLFVLAIIDRDLVDDDEGRFPLALFGGTALLAIVLPILFPGVLVHTSGGSGDYLSLRGAVEHTALGTLTGCGCGCLMFAATRGGLANVHQAALPALVGPYLGAWPTVTVVAAALLAFAVPLLFHAWRPGAWWRLPLLLWASTIGAILVAHSWPAGYDRLVESRFPINAAILGTFLVALLVNRFISRRQAGHIQ